MVVEFFQSNQAFKWPTSVQPQKPQRTSPLPEVIVFLDGKPLAFHGYAAPVLSGLLDCSKEKSELPENRYGALRIRFDGMRSLAGGSGRRASHSAVSGESALAFLRR